MPESSNKGGRKPRVTDEDILDVFRATPDPVLSTAEVAEAVPIKRRGTLNRLQSLQEDGELESKQIGGRNTVWWFVGGERITPDERAVEDHAERERERTERRREQSDDQRDGETSTPPSTPQEDSESGDIVDAVADGWDDTGDRLDARKDAARAVLAYAREHGTVSKQEAKEEVRPEYPVDGQNARTWYRKNIRPVLNEVAEYDQSARAYRLVDDGDAVEDGDSGVYDPTEEF
jgi:hypothetical protein